MQKFKSIELFAGAGGLALGLEQAGFKHIGLVEFNQSAANTLMLNRPEWNVICEDIAITSQRDLEKEFHIKHENVNVKLMGVASAEDIREALLHATAYIHTSYIDNSPNSLCEAMLLGVTSISTSVGGVPSLVTDGQTGFLVPANDPYQMAFLMSYIAEHPEINLEIGNAAREAAIKRHDKNIIAERVVNIYKSLINDK